MHDNFEKFYEIKCNLSKIARKMQQIYDKVHEILTPQQIAKCLCLLEKYKFEKGFSIEELMKEIFDKLNHEKMGYDPERLFKPV